MRHSHGMNEPASCCAVVLPVPGGRIIPLFDGTPGPETRPGLPGSDSVKHARRGRVAEEVSFR